MSLLASIYSADETDKMKHHSLSSL